MKFKVDENLPNEYASILRGAGFETDAVSDEKLSGVAFRSTMRGWPLRCEYMALSGILTFNDRDFARYRDIEAVHPRVVRHEMA